MVGFALMNERIKELELEAIAYADSKVPAMDRYNDIYHSIIRGKFAELIVRECASICELNGKSYKYSFTPMKARLAESTSTHCSELIKKHFGVEE